MLKALRHGWTRALPPLVPLDRRARVARVAIEHDDGLRAAPDFGEQTLFSEDRMDLVRRLADGYYFAVVGGSGGGAGGGGGQQAVLGRRGLAVLRADRPVQLLSPLVTFDEPRFKMPMRRHALLPWAVGLASFIVQTHIGYALFVPALGLWGAGVVAARLWRLRRDDADEWRQRGRSVRRHLSAALVVGLVCWSQSLYEQFFADGRGNLRQLV